MCEILVRVRDHVGQANLFQYSKLLKQGDVVCVKEDGHTWGAEELANSIFRVFALPNVTIAQAQTMLAAEADVMGASSPNPYLQPRQYYFDKTKILAGAATAYWNDDARASAKITLPYTAAQLQNIVSKRAAISGPDLPPPSAPQIPLLTG